MARRVVTLNIRNERITFDGADWAAIQQAVAGAMQVEGHWQKARGDKELVAAIGFTTADKSRLTRTGAV